MRIVAARGFEPRPHVCCPYTTRHPFPLSSSMTLTQDTHLLGIITHFQALSAIIAPSCYAASLYSPSFSLCKSVKEQVCWWKREDSNLLYMSNMHQSSVVIRASPIAPLPFAGLSRLSSQSLKVLFGFSLIMFISFNLFSLLRTLTHSGAFGCMWWSTVHPIMCIAKF